MYKYNIVLLSWLILFPLHCFLLSTTNEQENTQTEIESLEQYSLLPWYRPVPDARGAFANIQRFHQSISNKDISNARNCFTSEGWEKGIAQNVFEQCKFGRMIPLLLTDPVLYEDYGWAIIGLFQAIPLFQHLIPKQYLFYELSYELSQWKIIGVKEELNELPIRFNTLSELLDNFHAALKSGCRELALLCFQEETNFDYHQRALELMAYVNLVFLNQLQWEEEIHPMDDPENVKIEVHLYYRQHLWNTVFYHSKNIQSEWKIVGITLAQNGEN